MARGDSPGPLFSWMMIGWALFWVGFLVIYVLDRRYYLLAWLESDYREARRKM